MLWRTMDKMMAAVARRTDLPKGLPSLDEMRSEISAARVALSKRAPRVVLGHGDFKPSNVMEHAGSVRLIDFELAGPNFRGFDLMKAFRTASGPCMLSLERFLGAYAERVGEDAKTLLAE